LIQNKNEFLTDKFGRIGRLVNKDNIYAFQPIEITDENASLYERETPLEFKRDHIVLELPKEVSKEYYKELQEIKKKVEKEDWTEKNFILLEKIKEAEQLLKKQLSEKEIREIEKEVTESELPSGPEQPIQPIQKELSVNRVDVDVNVEVEKRDYEILMEAIHANFNMVFGPIVHIETAEKNWFKHMNHSVEHLLSVYQIPKENIEKYVVYKHIDHMDFEEKMVLIEHIYQDENENVNTFDSKHQINQYIKMYFERLLLNTQNKKGIVIGKEGGWKVYVKTEKDTEDMEDPDDPEKMRGKSMRQWVEGEPEDYKLFGRELDRYDVDDSIVNDLIGFITVFHGREIVFKLKDIRLKRNNIGARCDQKRKGDIVKILNEFLGKEVYDPKVNMISYSLCCIIEILMRYYTDIGKDGKVYFFPPEETAINDILRFTK
jgi:hypothetical protein